jgi:hypothetical protein
MPFSCKKLMSLRGMLNDGDTQDDELRKHPEKMQPTMERKESDPYREEIVCQFRFLHFDAS